MSQAAAREDHPNIDKNAMLKNAQNAVSALF
jgi:hypothetical protein